MSSEANKVFECPNCGDQCMRESVDVGVGIMYGPWGCMCGWSEDPRYNSLDGPSDEQQRHPDAHVSSTGMIYPRGYFDRLSDTINNRFGTNVDVAQEILGSE